MLVTYVTLLVGCTAVIFETGFIFLVICWSLTEIFF